jgi:hypothetical protein
MLMVGAILSLEIFHQFLQIDVHSSKFAAQLITADHVL